MTKRAIIVSEGSDFLQSARKIMADVWKEASLDSLLVSTWVEGSDAPRSLILEDPSALEDADPFAPVMQVNNAAKAAEIHSKNKSKKIGYFLRPCELRSFWSLIDRDQVDPDRSLLISSDCLGVYPDEDFHWRAAALSDPESLTQQSLQFAPQGGILPSRNRHGCQLCEMPAPEGADVQIGLFGVLSGDQLLVAFKDSELADRVLRDFRTQPVGADLLERRERVLQDVVTWRQKSLVREAGELEAKFMNEDALFEHLVECEHCTFRLKRHCPGFASAWPGILSDRKPNIFHKWLTSCGGCGICDHQCPLGFPLFDVIRQLSFQDQLDSTNPAQPLPL
jgi:formate dehydrogenase subunit beta